MREMTIERPAVNLHHDRTGGIKTFCGRPVTSETPTTAEPRLTTGDCLVCWRRMVKHGLVPRD